MQHLSVEMWAYGVLALVLIAAAVTDIRTARIYNAVTYPAIAIGLIGHTLMGGPRFGAGEFELGLLGSLCGLAAGFLPLFVAWFAGGIGGGDAKLMGAVGALAGWRFALAAMFYGFAIAVVMAVVVMLSRRILKQTLARIWRFLSLLATPAGAADPATKESPKIAFGLALCIGSAIALVEVLMNGPVAKKLWMGI